MFLCSCIIQSTITAMLPTIKTSLFSVFLVSFICNSCCGKTFHFGVAGPWEGFHAAGSHSAGALHIVVERILQDNTTFYEINRAGHEFEYAWTDTECVASVGVPRVADLMSGFGPLQNPIDVLIGGVCSVVCEPVGYLARNKNIPVISIGCYSNQLSDKSIHPTHARPVGPLKFVAPALVGLVKAFHFSRVAILSGPESVFASIVLL